MVLLDAFQNADRLSNGALSRNRERAIYPGLVTAVLRFVVVLFAEARECFPRGSAPNSLHTLYKRLVPKPQGTMLDTYEAWTFVLGSWGRMHDVLPHSSTADSAALFDSTATPFLATPLSDALVWRLLDTLFHGDGQPVDFAALDLEHVGTFYEGLMAFDSLDARIHYDISAPIDIREAPSDDRRRLGAHYTSRVITRIVVERALAPLVAPLQSPDELLALRICDPAMGSGAFLLETCRYLATELSRLGDRAGKTIFFAQRRVAEHCIYGVDKNPRAAELARWALWLLTSSPHQTGVFLHEHIRAGDSLVGRPDDADWFSGSLPAKIEKKAAEFRKHHQPFHWDDEFADVMNRGGFDVFLGNPPWISYAGRAAQPLDDHLRAYYMAAYPAFSGYRNLQGLFVARSARMLRPGGRLGFVLPSSMSELEGYGPTRRAHEAYCECDDDLPDLGDVFDDVFQPSMALLSTRRAEPITVQNPRPWPLHRADLDKASTALLERLAVFPTFPPELFGERGFQSMGEDIRHLHVLDAPEGVFRVGVRVGGDIEPFLRRPPKFYCDPTVFGSRFRSAEDWQTVALLFRQTARFPMAAPADGQAFRNSILAGFSSAEWSQFFLLAWVNSSPIRWYHYTRNRDARQGMPQVKIAHLRAIPAPRSRTLVSAIEDFGRTLGERNTGISPDEQAALDVLVADALELEPGEREIIAHWAKSPHTK